MAAHLPDLFLLSVFRKLSAQDRISACFVCTNWYHRVREVNQNVHFLTMTVDCEEDFSYHINCFNFGYNPSIKRQLMEETEEADREKLECSTEMNTLHFSHSGLSLNSTVAQQIITAFPAITELNFFNQSSVDFMYKYLVQMLDTSEQKNLKSWGPQLTALRLEERNKVSAQSNEQLYTAINRLPALKYLAITKCATSPKLPDHLPVLARLKEVRFVQFDSKDLFALLRSVKQYAADNAHLRIDLPNGLDALDRYLESINTSTDLPLDRHIRERVVRMQDNWYCGIEIDLQKTFCTSFPHLTSFSFNCWNMSECAQVFTFISQSLPHLSFLQLSFDLDDDEIANFPPLTTPLHSVKALELDVNFISHDDVQLLNLPVTMPNLQTIYFIRYHCEKCNISAYKYDFHTGTLLPEETEKFINCFGARLLQLHRTTTVPLEKITFETYSSMVVSAKQLFAQ